jgi:hypothetical protein
MIFNDLGIGVIVVSKIEANLVRLDTGIEISEKQFTAINLYQNDFHGEWNYSIFPD